MSKESYHSLNNVMTINEEPIVWSKQWEEAFGNPANCGLWFVWGNSGNGKSNFCMQLAKELAKKNRVLYIPLEEEYTSTFKQLLIQTSMTEVKRTIMFAKHATPHWLADKLKSRRSPQVIIVDSVQKFARKYEEIQKLISRFPNKLWIFVSQTEGKTPRGKAAVDCKFYAGQKIWVEGYKAISHGRSKPGGQYIIWLEGALKYWGTEPVVIREGKKK